VVTSSLLEEKLTGVTARKVVELEILYRPVINKGSPRLVIIPKTELERLSAEKNFEKSDLASMKCSENSLWRARIKMHTIENSFLYLPIQESLTYLLVCVRYGRNTGTI
jgi:hypothetical protein